MSPFLQINSTPTCFRYESASFSQMSEISGYMYTKPVACCRRCLVQVFPDPGKLARAVLGSFVSEKCSAKQFSSLARFVFFPFVFCLIFNVILFEISFMLFISVDSDSSFKPFPMSNSYFLLNILIVFKTRSRKQNNITFIVFEGIFFILWRM